jgi:hypothetical protein
MPSTLSPFSGFYVATAHDQLLNIGSVLIVAASSNTKPRSSSPSVSVTPPRTAKAPCLFSQASSNNPDRTPRFLGTQF